MSTVDRRQRKKQRTHEEIRAAAIALFAERGYRETTIQAVADEADVAARTVTGHFPAKEDLLFADEPFTAASLQERLAEAQPASALDVFRDWMAATMAELTEERTRAFWEQRRLRSRLILDNPELRSRARGGYHELEVVLAAAVAAERDEPPEALAPRLIAATVVLGVREVYASDDARSESGPPSPERLMVLVDRVIAFARAGGRALDA